MVAHIAQPAVNGQNHLLSLDGEGRICIAGAQVLRHRGCHANALRKQSPGEPNTSAFYQRDCFSVAATSFSQFEAAVNYTTTTNWWLCWRCGGFAFPCFLAGQLRTHLAHKLSSAQFLANTIISVTSDNERLQTKSDRCSLRKSSISTSTNC